MSGVFFCWAFHTERGKFITFEAPRCTKPRERTVQQLFERGFPIARSPFTTAKLLVMDYFDKNTKDSHFPPSPETPKDTLLKRLPKRS